MNSNLFHNLANIASLILAGATAVLIATGCVSDVSGSLDCSSSWLDAKYTALAIMILQALKLVVNVVRDGISGLTKPQPPVEQ